MLLNFASRFLICPLVVWIGQAVGAVRFATGMQILTVGLLLAALAITMDMLILPLVGNSVATLTDFLAATLFLWFAGQLAAGAVVTWTGAAVVGGLLAATEWAAHSWLGAVTRDRRRVR